jgi:hypothetical protein
MIGPGKLIAQGIMVIKAADQAPSYQLILIVVANDVSHGV